jgi:hypothetical protein
VSGPKPPSVRLLLALPGLDEPRINARAAYAAAGPSVRAGTAALRDLRSVGWAEGTNRWLSLTANGQEAAEQLGRPEEAARYEPGFRMATTSKSFGWTWNQQHVPYHPNYVKQF